MPKPGMTGKEEVDQDSRHLVRVQWHRELHESVAETEVVQHLEQVKILDQVEGFRLNEVNGWSIHRNSSSTRKRVRTINTEQHSSFLLAILARRLRR